MIISERRIQRVWLIAGRGDPMKKLRLEIEELAVESFATAEREMRTGTVRAYITEFGGTCDPGVTCGPETCGGAYCILDTQNANLCGGPGTGRHIC